uniref:Uncharacterized protein n=1 Tax=Glossina austeni TaxID=7395 RepID=A0A1A9UVD8_GLOAU
MYDVLRGESKSLIDCQHYTNVYYGLYRVTAQDPELVYPYMPFSPSGVCLAFICATNLEIGAKNDNDQLIQSRQEALEVKRNQANIPNRFVNPVPQLRIILWEDAHVRRVYPGQGKLITNCKKTYEDNSITVCSKVDWFGTLVTTHNAGMFTVNDHKI